VLWLVLRESQVKWYLPFRTITRLTPVPDLIEIFQRRMNSSEPVSESAMELLPKGLPVWMNILIVLVYTALAIFFSQRLMQRRRFV